MDSNKTDQVNNLREHLNNIQEAKTRKQGMNPKAMVRA